MVITINQKGSTYYIYKNLKSKSQEYDYYATDNSSGLAWYGNDGRIYTKAKEEVAYFYIHRRLFRKAELQLILPQENKPTEIIPKNIWNWIDLIWEFEYSGSNYRFQEHRKHFRTLYKNGKQVAAFEKNYISFFERDVFKIYANDDEGVLLLTCLALYSDLGNSNNGSALTFNYGNINGSKPPENGKWRPAKDKLKAI